MKRLTYIISLFLWCLSAEAGHRIGNLLEVDKTVHNFGDIIHKSGPVSCSFIVANTGSQPAVIYNVTSTCGCTDVKWTKEPIRPGQTGRISVTYSNDEGAYPFDKTLTVYTSDSKKPFLLKVRGVCIEKAEPLTKLYPVHFGPLALRDTLIKCGNMEQGGSKSEAVNIANISSKPVKISFKNIDSHLSISVSPNPIPANSTAEMAFTIKSDRAIWGKQTYYAIPVVDGKTVQDGNGTDKIGFWAFTKENFNGLTQEQKSKGPRPAFRESTYSFGKVKSGSTVHASFTFKNEGAEPFRVYRVNSDAREWSSSPIPTVGSGKEATFRFNLDTTGLPKGEHLTIVTLTTNSPSRPIINLFVAGYIE